MKISKVGAAILKNGKVLVVKESDWKKYGIPGGTLKKDETYIDCLRREMKEELKSDIKLSSLEFLGNYEDKAMNEHDKIIEIKLYKVELEGNPEKTSEIEDMFWFGISDDLNKLGPIDKNHLIPTLVERGLLQ